MATINGYTAERMKEIEDNTIVSGEVIDDELILVKYNSETVNAGYVRGPVGPEGPEGPMGPEGPIGPTGPQGEPGVVTFEDSIVIPYEKQISSSSAGLILNGDGTAVLSAVMHLADFATGTVWLNAAGTGQLQQPSSSGPPTGSMMPFGGNTAPTGWLLANGATVSRTTYASLFAVLGTKYGAGDGSTTFKLPDMRGRVPIGLDSTQTEFDTMGETGGAKTHTLTVNEIPSHRHPPANTSGNGFWVNTSAGGNIAAGTSTNRSTFDYTGYEGGGQAHNNLQPYQVVNYIIKT